MLYLGNEKLKPYLSNERTWLGVGENDESKWKGLRFVAEEDGSSVGWKKSRSKAPSIYLQYSMDDGDTWSNFSNDVLVDIPKGKWMCVKARSSHTRLASGVDDYNYFQMTGKIGAYGNIMSLLNGANFENMTTIPDYTLCFFCLFKDCTSLTKAPSLPATTLRNQCYRCMFMNCTSLTKTPVLPSSTRLIAYCYEAMFSGCTSLTEANIPSPPSIQVGSYDYMFKGCTSLRSIILGWSGQFSTGRFTDWVYGVSPTGTLYYNGSDTTRGTSAIPEGWTVKKF